MELLSTALAFGKEISATEPVVTWNLFFTAFIVPVSAAISSGVVIAYISWQWRKRDKKNEEITLLKKQLENEKERYVEEWRKNHQEILCKVKNSLDDLLDKHDGFVEKLGDKVDKDDCIREKSDVWDAVNKLREKR